MANTGEVTENLNGVAAPAEDNQIDSFLFRRRAAQNAKSIKPLA